MALSFPYTYISCPCSDESRKILFPKRISRDIDLENDGEDEEKTFDPRNPRSQFSLFPPEHLLYCEECHDIKCPRCVTEEIITWYCPGCLFEVPSSSVRSDDNRCSRNCFSCPICTSQLITASIGDRSSGPFVLNCNYCMWSSLDIGLKFESPNHLRSTINNQGVGGVRKKLSRLTSTDKLKGSSLLKRDFLTQPTGLAKAEDGEPEDSDKKAINANPKMRTEPNTQFSNLMTFYRDQLAMTANGGSGSSMLDGFSSPSSLTRIMNLYNNPGVKSLKSAKPQTRPMREAVNSSEGLILQSEIDEQEVQLAPPDYIDATTMDQRSFQYPRLVGNPDAKHTSQLWPMSTRLRTKRSKRCAECKHILVKPEFKVASTRYRIKLVALNYIPFVSLRPLPVPGGLPPPGPDGRPDTVLEPGKASQWIMKLTNPLFESVNVSLGCPSVTPGRHGHRVTILCPQFSIGKNGDVWDDALNSSGLSKATSAPTGESGVAAASGEQIAGKVYESGRNWVSVVVEIIPTHMSTLQKTEDRDEDEDEDEDDDDDQDVIEIPVRVRLEWQVSDEDGDRKKKKNTGPILVHPGNEDDGVGDDGKRELAYWMVVGIGRVATA